MDTTYRLALASCLLAALAGCASIAPTVDASTRPGADDAHIGGVFSRNKGNNFGFVIRSADGKHEYVMPMGEDTSLPTEVRNSSVAIKVQPGVYTVSEWMTYATQDKRVVSRKPVGDHILAKPFRVAPGALVLLGHFDARSAATPVIVGGTSLGIREEMQFIPLETASVTLQAVFAKAYPGFAQRAFTCLLCADTWMENHLR